MCSSDLPCIIFKNLNVSVLKYYSSNFLSFPKQIFIISFYILYFYCVLAAHLFLNIHLSIYIILFIPLLILHPGLFIPKIKEELLSQNHHQNEEEFANSLVTLQYFQDSQKPNEDYQRVSVSLNYSQQIHWNQINYFQQMCWYQFNYFRIVHGYHIISRIRITLYQFHNYFI